MTDAAPAPTVRSVERALDLLEALERSPAPLRLSDLGRAVGLHPATALRLLGVLHRRGLVTAEDGEYRIGVGALGLGRTFTETDPLSVRARPVLQQLADATSLTASLYVRTGSERILAVRVDGREPFRYELPEGRRLPLTIGSGKTLLAFLAPAERSSVLAALARAGTTDDAIRELTAELDTAHRNGYHVSIAERDPDVAAVSVPVLGPDGVATAALSVSSPVEKIDRPALVDLVPELRRASHALSRP